jgi:hypothetical protein
MKIICTFTLMLFLAIPVLAQGNNTLSKNDLRNEPLNSASKIMSSLLLEKQHLKIYKNPHFLYKANPGFRFIPIPPATEADHRAEMIPLYKDGERIVKFIKK